MGTEFCFFCFVFLKNKNSAICHGLVFLFKLPSEKSGVSTGPGASVTVPLGEYGPRSISPSVLWLLLSVLQVSCWGLTRAPQALLENVGICRLYPLVIVLFRFDDLKTELLVEVNCRLIADLHVTEEERRRKYCKYAVYSMHHSL